MEACDSIKTIKHTVIKRPVLNTIIPCHSESFLENLENIKLNRKNILYRRSPSLVSESEKIEN